MGTRQTLRTFYILIATQVFSLIGSEMTSFALGIWVFTETGSATPLGLVAFFATLPRIIAPSFAGVLADRWDRRHVMMLADAGQALGTCALMLSFLTDHFALWQLYVVAAFQATFGLFQGPAFQASVTMLVPDSQRDRANALQQVTGPAAGMVAPTLAGMVFGLVGVAGVMAIDLITFLVAIGVVLSVRIPRPPQSAEGRAARGTFWREAQVGFRYLWSRRPLFVMLLAATAVNFCFSLVGPLFTPYILSLTASEATLGLLMSLMSAGAIAGGVIMGVWGGTRPRIHTVMGGIVITGALLSVFGVARSSLALGLVMPLMMLPLPMVNAAFDSVMQVKTPPDLQGRVFSAVTQLAMLASPIAFMFSGMLADHVFEPAVGGSWWGVVEPLLGAQKGAGIGLIAVLTGLVIVAVTLAFYSMPSVRHLEANLPDYVTQPAAEAEIAAQEDEHAFAPAESAAV